MVAPKTQDLPPSGGYQKIRFARVPAKTLFSGFQIIGAYVGMYGKYKKYIKFLFLPMININLIIYFQVLLLLLLTFITSHISKFNVKR